MHAKNLCQNQEYKATLSHFGYHVMNWQYCPVAVNSFFFHQETKTEFYSATKIGDKVLVFYNSH